MIKKKYTPSFFVSILGLAVMVILTQHVYAAGTLNDPCDGDHTTPGYTTSNDPNLCEPIWDCCAGADGGQKTCIDPSNSMVSITSTGCQVINTSDAVAPIITSISPTHAAGGSLVTISGFDFSLATPTSDWVVFLPPGAQFNGENVLERNTQAVSSSINSLKFIVPPASQLGAPLPGTYQLLVQSAYYNSLVSNSLTFTIDPSPSSSVTTVTTVTTTGSAGSAGSAGGAAAQTGLNSTLSSAADSWSSILSAANTAASAAGSAGSAGAGGSATSQTSSDSSSCSATAATTIATSLQTLQGLATVLTSSNVSPGVLTSIQNLINAVAAVLTALAGCI